MVVDKLYKVLVVALFKDEISRHKAEDQMAGCLNGKGIVSYNYLKDNFDKKRSVRPVQIILSSFIEHSFENLPAALPGLFKG